MRDAGYLIIYTPLAKLCWDPVSHGKDVRGEAVMRERWAHVLQRDPYYNRNLSRESADFSLRK
jgi:hypothetical protein